VTCAELPGLDPDDRLLLEPLAELGVGADAVVWDDAGVDWGAYDLVVLRSTWDYARRRDEFVAWARTVPRLANPADVVAWNTDKRYLSDLVSAGLPAVPTDWIAPADAWALPTRGEWVIKPAVSAGSLDTGRYDTADPSHRELAAGHVARLQAADRLVMVQPYLPSVDTYGETSLLFFGGVYSHAIRKGPMLNGPDVALDGLYKEEDIEARPPTETELGVGARALAAVPGGAARLLYARVDLIPGRDGEPLVVELELTEPSLFLATSAEAPALFARAIATAARG
jgi:glutathione synthase/RimK-type ligase-like ATP-grasp enzyme